MDEGAAQARSWQARGANKEPKIRMYGSYPLRKLGAPGGKHAVDRPFKKPAQGRPAT